MSLSLYCVFESRCLIFFIFSDTSVRLLSRYSSVAGSSVFFSGKDGLSTSSSSEPLALGVFLISFGSFNELGLPAGTEALDPISPQYLGDLIAWNAIGARTTESQTHREMSSGLSTPVGFKNGTDGDIGIAINAILSASHPHSFLGLNAQGRVSIVRTSGNPHGHVVLRGGGDRPNYDTVSVAMAQQALVKAKLPPNIVIDCSHANSYKKPELQPLVMADVVNQIANGNQNIVGVMIESNLAAGNQSIPADLSQLKYGCSVTDACVDWETTVTMLRYAAERLRSAKKA